ncbi:MAG: hypothetical protein K8R91_05695 [Phycisphaerae bacterium]|nr:hypothetical protein [Phycisphaerae bacterium]
MGHRGAEEKKEQGNKPLLGVIFVISALLLAASYFLPVEASWSPWDACHGYYLGGEFVKGPNVVLSGAAPYAAGMVILLALVLMRRPKAGVLVIVGFASVWLLSITWTVIGLAGLPSLEFPRLWPALAILLIPPIVVMLLLSLMRFKKKTTVLTLATILAMASIFQQACSIAIFLLEDGLLLNVGSVTGMMVATALFVALLCQSQIHSTLVSQTSSRGISVSMQEEEPQPEQAS